MPPDKPDRTRYRADALVLHLDRASRLAAPREAVIDGQRGRVYEGRVARVQLPGDPLQYPWGVEYRNAPELAHVAKQLAGRPVTLDHPTHLIRDGAQARVIGKIIDGGLVGDHAVARIFVWDPAGIAAIEGGVHQLSLGYSCDTDAKRFQHNTAVDHLAVVPMARCGASCSLRVDAASVTMRTSSEPPCDCGCGGSSSVPGASPGTTCTNRASAVDIPGNAMPIGSTIDDPGDSMMDAKLNAEQRHALPVKHFAVPSREALPIEDEGHVRDAMARFGDEKFQGPAERKAAFHRIVARAHELGIDPKGFVEKYGPRLDEMESNMDGSTSTRSDAGMSDPDGDVPSGGGEGGRAQTGSDPGFAAPDIHKKLADALAGMKTQQDRADAAEQERDAHKDRADKAEQDRDEQKARADKAEKERDQYKAQLDAMRDERDDARKDAEGAKTRADAAEAAAKASIEKARLDADSAMQTLIAAQSAARADLLTKANAVLGLGDRAKQTDREIMCAVVKEVHSRDIESKESDDYVRARFDAAMERFAEVGAANADVRRAIHQNRLDAQHQIPTSGPAAEDAARKQMAESQANAWKKN